MGGGGEVTEGVKRLRGRYEREAFVPIRGRDNNDCRRDDGRRETRGNPWLFWERLSCPGVLNSVVRQNII